MEDFTYKNIITSKRQPALTKTLDYSIIYLEKTLNLIRDLNLKSLKEVIVLLIQEIDNVKKISVIFPQAILIHGTFRFMNIF